MEDRQEGRPSKKLRPLAAAAEARVAEMEDRQEGRPSKKPRLELSDTVTFNVGGKHFEVLREPTLALHPESLLNQLAEYSDGTEPIFVEANSDLFQYLLDYHRHRKVHIPSTVSKDAIVQEALTLGLPVKLEDIVQDVTPLRFLGACMADAMKVQVDEAAAALRNSRVATLGGLVIKRALEKVGRSASFEVSAADIVEMEGKEQGCPMCAWSDFPGPALTWGRRRGEPANTFEAAMAFLCQGVGEADLVGCLKPWATRNGFTLHVKFKKAEVRPTVGFEAAAGRAQYPSFSCRFA